MKWFKHKVASGDDPDIQEAVELYGPLGYYVFFRTLEIIGREFNVKTPGCNDFLLTVFTKKFQNSAKKTLKLLQYFKQKKRIFFVIRGSGKGRRIIINCPKLKTSADEYTQKLIKKKSGQKPDTSPDLNPPIELEEELEEEKNLKTDGRPSNFQPSTNDIIEHGSDLLLTKKLESTCEELYQVGKFKQAHAFRNTQIKKHKNKRAILKSLIALSVKPELEGDPWAYCEKIMQRENGNYNEKDAFRHS